MALVDFDDNTAVYVARRPENAALIHRDAYDVIHPVLLPAAFAADRLAQAVAEAERAVQRHPEAMVAGWILATAYAQQGRPQEALLQLDALSRLTATGSLVGPLQVAQLGLRGLLELQQGRCPAARRALEKAVAIDPAYRPAQELLQDIGC